MIRTTTQTPIDANNKEIANSNQMGTALAVTYDATISSATSVVLNASTTCFEVSAFTQSVLLRYAAAVSTSAFDAVIPANTTRMFMRPDGVTTISVIEAAATGAVAVIEY